MTLLYGISGVTNSIENHSYSMILPHCSIRYKLSQRTSSLSCFGSVKTNMLEKGRRSDSSQLIPTRWGKTLSRYLLRASDIFKKHHRCLQALHVQILKRMEKSLRDSCAPKAKLPTLNFWFLAKVSSIFGNTERMKKSVQLTLR